MINNRKATVNDVTNLKLLAIKSWQPYQNELKEEHWKSLSNIITNIETFLNLLEISTCFVAETDLKEIIGMAFFVPSGQAFDIFEKEWTAIRFVSVDAKFG